MHMRMAGQSIPCVASPRLRARAGIESTPARSVDVLFVTQIGLKTRRYINIHSDAAHKTDLQNGAHGSVSIRTAT